MTSDDQQKPVSASPVKPALAEGSGPAVAPAAEPVVTPPLAQPVSSTSRSSSASPSNKTVTAAAAAAATISGSEQAPAQLALLLSSALADADALRRELASEKKRAARAERLLAALQTPVSPNLTGADTELKISDGRLPEGVAKAVVDAEARAEQAERYVSFHQLFRLYVVYVTAVETELDLPFLAPETKLYTPLPRCQPASQNWSGMKLPALCEPPTHEAPIPGSSHPSQPLILPPSLLPPYRRPLLARSQD